MQKWLAQNRSRLAAATGALVALAFGAKILFGNAGAAQLLFLIASIIGIVPIAYEAVQALRVHVVSIDLLVTIAMLGDLAIQEFEESAAVAFLFLFGAYLEQRTLAKTRSAIKDLTEMAPETARRKAEDGTFEEVDIDEVEAGDTVQVQTGGKIPVDGTVTTGSGAVDEASITGEPLPAAKEAGSKVFAGTILQNGTLELMAERTGEDTAFGRIVELVEEAQDSKTAAERFIDRFSKVYTPAVLAIALIVWIATRNTELAVTILVLGCPGALVIGVPVSNVAGIGNGAKHGILFKGSDAVTKASHIDTMLFDKTGKLTYGTPHVVEERFYGKDGERELAEALLASAERESGHPLAHAIAERHESLPAYTVDATDVVQGQGVKARVAGHEVLAGNRLLMESSDIELAGKAQEDLDVLEEDGDSIVLGSVDGHLVLALGIRDEVREGMREDLEALKRLGVKKLVLLSGDSQKAAEQVGHELGLDEVRGGLLPEDKAAFARERQEAGETVAFVGDGINDSPSLAAADIGIAMGSGTDVAIETSDVVLVVSDFHKMAHALGLAKATSRNMAENIAIALIVVAVLLAGLVGSTWMNMALGMLVHEGSILVVILNAMRLLKFQER